MTLTRIASGRAWQFEMPVGSIGIGEYAVAYDAASGEHRAQTLVPFRVRP
jgi:hypothetical protein